MKVCIASSFDCSSQSLESAGRTGGEDKGNTPHSYAVEGKLDLHGPCGSPMPEIKQARDCESESPSQPETSDVVMLKAHDGDGC